MCISRSDLAHPRCPEYPSDPPRTLAKEFPERRRKPARATTVKFGMVHKSACIPLNSRPTSLISIVLANLECKNCERLRAVGVELQMAVRAGLEHITGRVEHGPQIANEVYADAEAAHHTQGSPRYDSAKMSHIHTN